MRLEHFGMLIKTLEAGTILKASEELGYSQSGLTKMLNALEEELGVKILIRDRHGVHLTAEGEILYPAIKTLMNDSHRIEQIAQEIGGLKKGKITIGTFNSVSAQWLPGIIKEFNELHPGIQFELLHGTNDEILQFLKSNRADIGFTRYGTASDMDEQFLIKDPLVVLFAENSKESERESIRLEEIVNLPYISLNEGVDDEITEVLGRNNVQLIPSFVESDDHAVIAMVEQGLGISIMSEMMLKGFSRKVVCVPLEPGHYRQIGIACRARDELSRAAAEFLEHCLSWVEREA